MKHTLIEKTEPEIAHLSVPLRALWHAAQGHWDTAHKLVQDDPSSDSAWVHAYLHRVEGDIGNAHYWYHQAGKKPATGVSLEQELESLIEALDT
jgi:hypothetical protein